MEHIFLCPHCRAACRQRYGGNGKYYWDCDKDGAIDWVEAAA